MYTDAGNRPACSRASISPWRIALPFCTRRLCPRPTILLLVHEDRTDRNSPFGEPRFRFGDGCCHVRVHCLPAPLMRSDFVAPPRSVGRSRRPRASMFANREDDVNTSRAARGHWASSGSVRSPRPCGRTRSRRHFQTTTQPPLFRQAGGPSWTGKGTHGRSPTSGVVWKPAGLANQAGRNSQGTTGKGPHRLRAVDLHGRVALCAVRRARQLL